MSTAHSPHIQPPTESLRCYKSQTPNPKLQTLTVCTVGMWMRQTRNALSMSVQRAIEITTKSQEARARSAAHTSRRCPLSCRLSHRFPVPYSTCLVPACACPPPLRISTEAPDASAPRHGTDCHGLPAPLAPISTFFFLCMKKNGSSAEPSALRV